jgi:predicted nucleic acid-binding protein
MNTDSNKYCLDANVLIQAWQKYYNPRLCPDYWVVLNELGKQNIIFIPELVREEIIRTDDDLSEWLKNSDIPIHYITGSVTAFLQKIYSHTPTHKTLVDNTKHRSLADPWVIAHALDQNAVVVTKENKETALNTKRIKIPNVCENMGIRWLDDFGFIEEVGIRFACSRNL